MQTTGWFVKCLASFEDFRRLIVDAEFVLTFEHINEPRTWVPMGQPGLSRTDCHFNDRDTCRLSVQLLLYVVGGNDFHRLTILMVVRHCHSTNSERSPDRHQN